MSVDQDGGSGHALASADGPRAERRPSHSSSAPLRGARTSFAGADPSAADLKRLRNAASQPLLSAADEVRLARRIERGDLAAKERMIEANLRLVFMLARQYRGRGVPDADLVQEGSIGLVRAVERFDHRRGLKFSTYAVWWIRRSFLDAINTAQAIRIPAKAARQLAAVRHAEAEIQQRGHARATTAAVAERTGISPSSVEALQAAARVTASLDAPVRGDGAALGDLVVDLQAPDPVASAARRESQSEALAMLRLLPQRHCEVLIRRFGLGGSEPQSHKQIGALLGIGEERCRQLEREALHRLRAVVGVARDR